MADPAPSDASPQPKAALNYRLGGDHCHVCMYYTANADDVESGTCSKVLPPNVSGHDLCDAFKRKAHMSEEDAEGEGSSSGVSPLAENLARRGMISDRQMTSLRGRGY